MKDETFTFEINRGKTFLSGFAPAPTTRSPYFDTFLAQKKIWFILLVLCRLSPAIENLSPWLKIGDNRLKLFTINCRNSRYGSKFFHNIWFICGWLGSSKRSNTILHLFSTYFKFNSYKIEAKNALNLAKPHDFSRDGRSHIVVDSRNLIGQFRLRNIG